MADSQDIILSGWGAVSPAGWCAADLREAVLAGIPLPFTQEQRQPGGPVVSVRPVPAPPPSPLLRHPRLRRSTQVARFAALAAQEALGEERAALVASGELRLGVVFGLMNGCVSFSRRFFAEALENPALASPILFPETVFNAPSSHLSAIFGSHSPNATLVGDSAQFFSAMEMAVQWLLDDEVDICLVVSAEELDWVSAESQFLFDPDAVTSEGAGAIYLEKRPARDGDIVLQSLPDSVPIRATRSRSEAARQLAESLQAATSLNGSTLLVTGECARSRQDAAETGAWTHWTGPRHAPGSILGNSFSTLAAWQTVLACELLQASARPGQSAVLSSVGGSEKAAGAVLRRV